MSLFVKRYASAGSNSAQRNVHACVHKRVICAYRVSGVSLVVFHFKLKLIARNAAVRIDFVNGYLSALLNGYAVSRIVAGKRTGAADDYRLIPGSVAAVAVRAARRYAYKSHNERKYKTNCLFHS